MSGKLTRIFQKRSRSSIRLSIRDDIHLSRTSYVYFLSPDRLTTYLRRNPAGDTRHYGLAEQDPTDVDFSDLDLRRTDFSKATLHDANFKGARLDDANISDADLTGAIFDKDQLTKAKGKAKYGPEGPLTAARIIKLRDPRPAK